MPTEFPMDALQKRQHQCDTTGNNTGTRMWSDLPHDVINMIMARLTFDDQTRFHSVCKSWHLPFCLPFPDKLPCLMTYCWHALQDDGIFSVSFKFHLPSAKDTCTVEHAIKGEQSYEDFHGASVCAAKQGWLLLQKSSKPFVCNPFSGQFIKLPRMPLSFNRSTFSSTPNSRNCIYFALQSSKTSKDIRISVCREGDQQWSVYTFCGFFKAIEDVVYTHGLFYCVFTGGVLGVFDVVHHSWDLLTSLDPIDVRPIWSRSQLVVSNGELFLVYHSDTIHVFRYDCQHKTWVTVTCLGDQVFFLGCTSFSLPADKRWPCNRVYFLHEANSCFHSLDNSMTCKCDDVKPLTIHDWQPWSWTDVGSLPISLSSGSIYVASGAKGTPGPSIQLLSGTVLL